MRRPPHHPPLQLDSLLRTDKASGHWLLDPAQSSVKVAGKHFWGLITVRGRFDQFTGSADVRNDGRVTASLSVEAASVDTKNAKRDKHLRSVDFFDADTHPTIDVSASDIRVGPNASARGELVAAGESHPLEFDAQVSVDLDVRTATLDTTVVVDHSTFGMTWRPLRMAAKTAQITAHLVFEHNETSH